MNRKNILEYKQPKVTFSIPIIAILVISSLVYIATIMTSFAIGGKGFMNQILTSTLQSELNNIPAVSNNLGKVKQLSPKSEIVINGKEDYELEFDFDSAKGKGEITLLIKAGTMDILSGTILLENRTIPFSNSKNE